ncbi:MAG: DUF308 domain-containing protein [Bacteroidota bacterium]|nr:DUF308 domain-containing protein [Bacteroidota bacterium]
METFKKSAGWALIIRGLLFSFSGLLIFFMKWKDLNIPANFPGILLLILGSVYVVLAILLIKTNKSWIWGLIWGLLDLSAGAYIIFNLEYALELITLLVGVFAILMGIATIVSAFYIKSYRIFLYLNSVLSFIFGLLILLNPFEENTGRNFLVVLYAILLGAFLMYCGYSLIRISTKKMVLNPENEKIDETEAI